MAPLGTPVDDRLGWTLIERVLLTTPPPLIRADSCAFERCQAGGVILERAPRVAVGTFVFHPGCAAAVGGGLARMRVTGWVNGGLVAVPVPDPVDGRTTEYRGYPKSRWWRP